MTVGLCTRHTRSDGQHFDANRECIKCGAFLRESTVERVHAVGGRPLLAGQYRSHRHAHVNSQNQWHGQGTLAMPIAMIIGMPIAMAIAILMAIVMEMTMTMGKRP